MVQQTENNTWSTKFVNKQKDSQTGCKINSFSNVLLDYSSSILEY